MQRADTAEATRGPRVGLSQPDRYSTLVGRVAAAAASGEQALRCYSYQREPPGTGAGGGGRALDLLVVRIDAATAGVSRHVLLSGGMHGDEPAGAEAVVRFLEERRARRWPGVAFTVLPCVNPWGFVHGQREGPGGTDLNRGFRRATAATRELSVLKRVLRHRPFDLVIDCHEDSDAPGLYAVAAPVALGAAAVRAARHVGPVHRGANVDGLLPLAGGVVDAAAPAFRALRQQARSWPLLVYVAAYQQRGAPGAARWQAGLDEPPLVPPGLVIETPTRLPLERRVAMHLAAIDAAVGTVI